jgi:hypothetical protein
VNGRYICQEDGSQGEDAYGDSDATDDGGWIMRKYGGPDQPGSLFNPGA